MVRFIMEAAGMNRLMAAGFTFQYGQIYYEILQKQVKSFMTIYIPIWLDLLC